MPQPELKKIKMNYLKNLLVRDDDDENEEEEGHRQKQNEGAVPAEVEQLSADELRRRRLARFSETATPSPTPSTPAAASVPAAAEEVKRVELVARPEPTKRVEEGAAAAPKRAQEAAQLATASTPKLPQSAANSALVQLLRITLSSKQAQSLPNTIFLESVAQECGRTVLDGDNLDEALSARLYLDPNDFSPRPSESPLVYIIACFQRLPAVLRQYESERALLDQAKQLLINYAVTYLLEPSLFPSSCLAKSSATGPCDPEHEAIDLLKRQDTSSNFVHFLCTILPEVVSQRCGKEIVRPWLNKLSQDQKQFRDQTLEAVFAQLCCARANKTGWAHFIAEILHEERLAFNPASSMGGSGNSNAGLGALFGFGTVGLSNGAKFEHESVLSPFFASISVAFEGEDVIRQSVMDAKRVTLSARHKTLSGAILEFCKTDEYSRNEILAWMELGLELNEERGKDRPTQVKISSDSFVLSIAYVLLELCAPFFSQEKGGATLPVLQAEVVEYMTGASRAFPPGETKLFRSGEPPAAVVVPSSKKFKFQTRAFALALRAVNLGPVVTFRRLKVMQRNYHHYRDELGENDPQIRLMGKQITTLVTTSFEPTLVHNLLMFASLTCRWLSALLPSPAAVAAAADAGNESWKQVCEFVVSDIPEIFIQVGQMNDTALESCDTLAFVSDFFIQAIEFDEIVAHVRAPMGDALFWAFLPEEAKQFDQQQRRENVGRRFAPSTRQLCLESAHAQTSLVPALMKLYGDVQVTGFYQVSAHRQLITKLLAYLWKISLHRDAFRAFAETSAKDESDSAFIKLANGILNQTNSNVAESLAKLREIRKIQLEQKTPAWTELAEEERKQKLALLDSNEREVASCLMMANDATDMLAYLSTDAAFVRAFTVPTLRSRLVDMLASILGSLASKKNAEFKIDNPEKYNFFPKKMLTEIVQTLLNCCSKGAEERQLFVESLAKSAYFTNEAFVNADALVRRHGMVQDATSMNQFRALVDECELTKQRLLQEDEDLGEIPEEFLDPLLQTLMQDPVKLPGSKMTVDRETIVHHLLQNSNDPFDRSPLELSQVVPDLEIKAKIQAWREELSKARRLERQEE